MSSDTSSVEQLKAELKSIKDALDKITSRPEFSASAYKYSGDPIYLQTNECPSPFTACDASAMDCPEDKYGQPEMYTANGERCYRSGSLARAAFDQYKQSLESSSPQTLVAQIRELVKSAAMLSATLKPDTAQGEAVAVMGPPSPAAVVA